MPPVPFRCLGAMVAAFCADLRDLLKPAPVQTQNSGKLRAFSRNDRGGEEDPEPGETVQGATFRAEYHHPVCWDLCYKPSYRYLVGATAGSPRSRYSLALQL
jgi:hypothetical protein